MQLKSTQYNVRTQSKSDAHRCISLLLVGVAYRAVVIVAPLLLLLLLLLHVVVVLVVLCRVRGIIVAPMLVLLVCSISGAL